MQTRNLKSGEIVRFNLPTADGQNGSIKLAGRARLDIVAGVGFTVGSQTLTVLGVTGVTALRQLGSDLWSGSFGNSDRDPIEVLAADLLR